MTGFSRYNSIVRVCPNSTLLFLNRIFVEEWYHNHETYCSIQLAALERQQQTSRSLNLVRFAISGALPVSLAAAAFDNGHDHGLSH